MEIKDGNGKIGNGNKNKKNKQTWIEKVMGIKRIEMWKIRQSCESKPKKRVENGYKWHGKRPIENSNRIRLQICQFLY